MNYGARTKFPPENSDKKIEKEKIDKTTISVPGKLEKIRLVKTWILRLVLYKLVKIGTFRKFSKLS